MPFWSMACGCAGQSMHGAREKEEWQERENGVLEDFYLQKNQAIK